MPAARAGWCCSGARRASAPSGTRGRCARSAWARHWNGGRPGARAWCTPARWSTRPRPGRWRHPMWWHWWSWTRGSGCCPTSWGARPSGWRWVTGCGSPGSRYRTGGACRCSSQWGELSREGGAMPMEVDLGPSARAFRDEVRGWLEANRPEDLMGVDAEQIALQRLPGADAWAARLHEAGLMCVSWPKEYGGRGLGGVEVAVLNEEFARAGVPRITRGMGEWLVGPSIIVWGSDEQKAHFLPRIIDGTDRYCQGFSEPDAGSDLASLKTRGV